jgi:hypothetical protein
MDTLAARHVPYVLAHRHSRVTKKEPIRRGRNSSKSNTLSNLMQAGRWAHFENVQLHEAHRAWRAVEMSIECLHHPYNEEAAFSMLSSTLERVSALTSDRIFFVASSLFGLDIRKVVAARTRDLSHKWTSNSIFHAHVVSQKIVHIYPSSD